MDVNGVVQNLRLLGQKGHEELEYKKDKNGEWTPITTPKSNIFYRFIRWILGTNNKVADAALKFLNQNIPNIDPTHGLEILAKMRPIISKSLIVEKVDRLSNIFTFLNTEANALKHVAQIQDKINKFEKAINDGTMTESNTAYHTCRLEIEKLSKIYPNHMKELFKKLEVSKDLKNAFQKNEANFEKFVQNNKLQDKYDLALKREVLNVDSMSIFTASAIEFSKALDQEESPEKIKQAYEKYLKLVKSRKTSYPKFEPDYINALDKLVCPLKEVLKAAFKANEPNFDKFVKENIQDKYEQAVKKEFLNGQLVANLKSNASAFSKSIEQRESPEKIRQSYGKYIASIKSVNTHSKYESDIIATLDKINSPWNEVLKAAYKSQETIENIAQIQDYLFDAAAESPQVLDLTKMKPTMQALADAKHLRLGIGQLEENLKRILEYKADLPMRIKNLEANIAKLNDDIETSQAKEPKKENKTWKAWEKLHLALQIDLGKKEKSLAELKNPKFNFINIVLVATPQNPLITEKHVQLLEQLKEINSPRVTMINNSESLTLDFIPKWDIKGAVVKELKLNIDSLTAKDVAILNDKFPDLVFMNLENCKEIKKEVNFSGFKKMQWVRLPQKMLWNTAIPQPLKLNQSSIDAETAKKFLSEPTGFPHDITLKIKEKEIPAYRAVLANFSHILRQMMLDKNNNIAELDIVYHPSFDKVLSFAITEQIEIASVNEALELMYYAESLKIPEIYKQAYNYIQKELNIANYSALDPETLKLNSLHVQNVLRLFVEKNKNSLTGQEEILNKPFPVPAAIEDIAPLTPSMDDAASVSLSDYAITVGETQFPVHKAILASRSGYFRNYFQKWNGENAIEHKEITPEQRAATLNYLYNGTLPSIADIKMAEDILWIADHDQIEPLRKLAFDYIAEKKLPSVETVNLIGNADTAKVQAILKELRTYMDLNVNYARVCAKGITKLVAIGQNLLRAKKGKALLIAVREAAAPFTHLPQIKKLISDIDDRLALLLSSE